MFDPGYRASLQAVAVHYAGVQLVGLIAGKYRAHSGVEQRTLLQQPNGLGHGIQRAGARDNIFCPLSTIVDSAATYSRSRSGVICAREIAPAPP